MCGRYQLGKAQPSLYARYAHLGLTGVGDIPLLPGLNIAPTAFSPVVFRIGAQAFLEPMRWGLIPRWTKSLDALKSKPFNARCEGVVSSRFFCDAFKNSRCLVPSTGFYEWKGAKAPKQPYLIQATDQEVFSFAGLWSSWTDPNGVELRTFTILTTEPNALCAQVHNRMPVILPREDEEKWIDPAVPCEELEALMQPYPAEQMTMTPVTRDLQEPLATQGELFMGMEESA